MKGSFEGIGQWAATFACGSGVKEGKLVKISGEGTVGPCSAGEDFCGVAAAVGRDGAACTVVLGGLVSAAFTGAAPALGFAGLTADGSGGVKTGDGGRKHLVVSVDTAAKLVTFVL